MRSANEVLTEIFKESAPVAKVDQEPSCSIA